MLRNGRVGVLTIALLFPVLIGLRPGAGEAATTRGQVLSVTIEDCGAAPGSCEGRVTLWTEKGKKMVVQVPDETKILRAGKEIELGELGVGQVAKFVDIEYDVVGGMMRAKSIRQAP